MTKDEALQALKEGKKVRHRYFSSDEWMKKYKTGWYIFEDGVCCSVREFWRMRHQEGWDSGWSIVE